MHVRLRSLRVLLAGLAALLAVAGLAGCRSAPTVAAYVGSRSISAARLDAAVAQRESGDRTLAAYGRAHSVQFSRQVLGFLVTQDIYDRVSQRYSVHVSDDAVRARIGTLLAGNDPTQVYGQLAAQGISRADVFENVRQQLIRQQVATKAGLAGSLSDAALRARYQQVKSSLAQKQFGYITVADQATADSVLAQLTADPSSYPTLAAQHPGTYTLPTLSPTSSDQIPSALASGVAAAKPNSGFTVPFSQTGGGVVVVFVGSTVIPTFEQARAQLLQAAQRSVDTSAQKLVAKTQDTLHVTVNPRYGVLKNGSVTTPTGGVVDILSGTSAASAASTGAAASGTTGTSGAGTGTPGS